MPATVRKLVPATRLEAALEWLLCEHPASEPVSIASMRALAEKELRRPRDYQHRLWAEAFLSETEAKRL